MPTAKISVVHLLDHGPLAATTAAASRVNITAPASAITLLPGESADAVMRAVKNISLADRNFSALGKLIIAAKNMAQVAALSIDARYKALGGTGGFLGANTTPVSPCPDGVGFFQHFKGGSIYWSPRTGAHEVHGAIRAKWSAMGWERSFLGYPRTDETPGNDTLHQGRFNHFEGGSIYWHPAAGAFEVHGAIAAKYRELGAEESFLGYPTTDETGTPDRIGRFNHFQGGSIYWTPATGAHEVHGLIRGLWAQLGWERNAQLGYPISDELVPHRGVGFTPAPSIRKPIADLPLDVIRRPEEQPSPTFTPAVAASVSRVAILRNISFAATATRAATASPPAPAATAAAPSAAARSILTRGTLAVSPGIIRIPPSVFIPAASHKGQSQDRYGDFENGVLFWKRGTNAATQLSPRATAPDGTDVAWTGQEIAALASPQIRSAIGAIPGGNVIATNFSGTTGTGFDGAGVHNRAHRVQVILQGLRMQGIIPVPAITTVEVRVEVSFDPVDREIVGYLTGWTLTSSMGDFMGGGSLERTLHQRLDDALWRQFHIAHIKGTEDDPIAVLSVKTQADGSVVVYFEP